MKRFGLLGLGLLVVLVATAASATSALAVGVQPSNLPIGAKSFSGESEGALVFHNVSAGDIECKTAAALEGTENEETSNEPPLGPFHWHIKECKSNLVGIACTGLAEPTGTILILGTWRLVFDKPLAPGTFSGLTAALLLLVSAFTVHCGSIVLFEFKGELLCLHLKPAEANKVHSYHCPGEGSKANEEWCMKGDEPLTGVDMCLEPLVPSFLASVNKGTFTEALILALGNTNYLVALTGMV